MSQNTKDKEFLVRISELETEIKKLKSRKRYGLVWEDKPEKVVELCKQKLPILTEDEDKYLSKKEGNLINILIEGDNFHSLSVLNYTHNKKVDFIYIDPPYNTGKKDFIYNDHFVDEEDTYRHSKWLAFMDRRLRLAKNLLSDDGVIFISIDDNEFSQLKLLCDEIFLSKNFIQNFMWLHGKGKKDTWSRTLQQYILCYAKNKDKLPAWSILNYTNYKFDNPDNDKRGGWFSGSVSFSEERSNKLHPNFFEIKSPSGIIWKRQWQRTREEMDELLDKKKIFFGYAPEYDAVPRIKIFPDDIDEQIPPNIIDGVDTTRDAQKMLDNMFGKKVFDYPKPVNLIKHFLKIASKKNSTILDFMAGSGTTAQAVLETNEEDKGSRKFILCTNNENKICEDVCYPRIKKVLKENNLKYFRTDFVDAKQTDQNKKKLVDKSTEMLCLKEDCFEQVKKGQNFKIFKDNQDKYLGIVYDDLGIEPFKKEIQKLDKKITTYIFSLDDSAREEEFEDIKKLVDLKPIPAVILNVYKQIFK